jgi:DNA-binding response OmpR family regulator
MNTGNKGLLLCSGFANADGISFSRYTRRANEEPRGAYMELNMDTLLTKPFDLRELSDPD